MRGGILRKFFDARALAYRAYTYAKGMSKNAPWPLILNADCVRYGSLPDDGGVLNQDEGLMYLMRICVTGAKVGLKKLADYDKRDMEFRMWADPNSPQNKRERNA